MTSYRDSRIYGLDEICELLRSADRHLSHRTAIVLIGGAAASFHHATSTTTDVDTHLPLSPELQDALAQARAETKLAIPVAHAAVAEFPYNFEDRLERVLVELERLEVFVLERHDLALSKSLRGYDHDLQQLEEVHAENPLSFDTLVDRFRNEMDHVVGEPRRIRQNFLDLIDHLFGEHARVRANGLISGERS